MSKREPEKNEAHATTRSQELKDMRDAILHALLTKGCDHLPLPVDTTGMHMRTISIPMLYPIGERVDSLWGAVRSILNTVKSNMGKEANAPCVFGLKVEEQAPVDGKRTGIDHALLSFYV